MCRRVYQRIKPKTVFAFLYLKNYLKFFKYHVSSDVIFIMHPRPLGKPIRIDS